LRSRMKLPDFGSFLIRHFLKEFLGGFLRKVGQEVSRRIGGHFLDDVGGFFGVEFFDDLCGKALIELGKHSGGRFFIERGNDTLALGGRKLFHHLGQVGRVQVLEFFVGDAEFYAAKGIGFDKVDKLPANRPLRKLVLEPAD